MEKAGINWRSSVLAICVGSLLVGLPTQAFNTGDNARIVTPSVSFKRPSTQLSIPQLQQLAKAITVKVLSGDTWGSGIIVSKQGQTYTVLTNYHVLIPGLGSTYQIQTPDNHTYSANWLTGDYFGDNDLRLLQFHSARAYTVASLETSSSLTLEDEVFAAGFPAEAGSSKAKGFVFTSGRISLLPDQAFVWGYQIGYTNEVQKGMSGGPLVNRQGKVVGINGVSKYPPWGNPYIFKNGSTPSEATQEQMRHLSWAIPIQTFLQLAPQFPHS